MLSRMQSVHMRRYFWLNREILENKINIFNILTSQKRDMTELKLVWPVNMTGHLSTIILNPDIVLTMVLPTWNSVVRFMCFCILILNVTWFYIHRIDGFSPYAPHCIHLVSCSSLTLWFHTITSGFCLETCNENSKVVCIKVDHWR